MKQLINLLPACIVSSIFSLGGCYFCLYRWSVDGFSEIEILTSLYITIPIFLSICCVTYVPFLNKFFKGISELNSSGLIKNWLIVSIFLIMATVIISIFLDYLYFKFDNYIFTSYSEKLAEILKDDNANDSTLEEFKNSTFFMQTIFQSSFGITLAAILSSFITKKYAKNETIQN